MNEPGAPTASATRPRVAILPETAAASVMALISTNHSIASAKMNAVGASAINATATATG
jgi:hypothetical protein